MRAQGRARGAGGVGGGGPGAPEARPRLACCWMMLILQLLYPWAGGCVCLPPKAPVGPLLIYFLPLFLGRRTWWMLGITPPEAMVTLESSLESSSSLRMAS